MIISTAYAPHMGILCLIIAGLVYLYIKKQPNGSETMVYFEAAIHEGAISFLLKEYSVLIAFIAFVSILLGIVLGQWKTSIAFVTGAICSMVAVFSGITAATRGNSRTAEASNRARQEKAFIISYLSGSVIGLTISGMCLIGLGIWFRYYWSDPAITKYISGFAMGAGSVALFSCLGGGIFAKAADLVTDLIRKMEAGITRDDPRNSGVIVSNIGASVGGIAGTGTDIFESLICALIASITVGATLHINTPDELNTFIKEFPVLKDLDAATIRMKFMAMPLLIAMAGIISSVIGIFSIKFFKNNYTDNALSYTTIISAGILAILTVIITVCFDMPWGILLAMLSGLIYGFVIGLITKYFTSGSPVQHIAEQSKAGAGAVLIEGLATGMGTIYLPVICICIVSFIGYQAAGIYGIGISAVGMLSTIGTTMTVNVYGAIAENSVSISGLAGLGPESGKITQTLDSLSDTTVRLRKNFTTGSAILTALALLMAFVRVAEVEIIDVRNPYVIFGAFVGAVIPMVCAAMMVTAVKRTTFRLAEEIRRQLRENPGLIEGKEDVRPDTKRCVSIASISAFKEMTAPGLLILLLPIAITFLLGKEAVGGMLLGLILMGAFLAIFLTNSSMIWSGAKKYIGSGRFGGKGSDNYKSVILGDTVGDLFKDISSPLMNIIIKIVPVISIVVVPALPNLSVF